MEEDIRGQVIEQTYNGIRYALYVPENVTEDTPIFTYAHGSGGTVDWTRATNVLNEKGANSIIVMPTMAWEADWGTNTIQIVNHLQEQYGLTNNNVSSSGFSMGGSAGYSTVAENLKQNSDLEPQIVYYIDDYSNKTYYNYKTALADTETIDLFKENNTIFFILEPTSKNCAATNAYGESELNVIRVICHNQNHVGVNNSFFNNAIYDYMAGGTLPEEGYTYQVYNQETGKWENIDYAAIATKEALYNYYNIDTFTTRLKSLSNLADITIESDDKTLENYLNEIRGTIRNTNFLQGSFTEDSYVSTTNVPSQIPEIVNTYFQATSTLLTKIANETTQFAKIALSIENLDFNLTQEVEDITTDSLIEETPVSQIQDQTSTTTSSDDNQSLSATVSTAAGIIGGSIAGVVSTITPNTTSNTTSTNQQNTQQSSQQIAQNTTANINQSTNQNSNSTVEEIYPLDEFPNYEELYSDDTKIVYNYNDEYKIIVHKDNDKIIGVECYYDFQNSQEAVKALETISEKYTGNETISKIVQSDRYIKVIFKEESYQDFTIDTIKIEIEKTIGIEELIKL